MALLIKNNMSGDLINSGSPGNQYN